MEEEVTVEQDSRPIPKQPTKSYSIWSLLVLTTLIAAVLSFPRRITSGPAIFSVFVSFHQFSLWLLVGTLIWMLLGKRRLVLIIESVIAGLVWGPLFASAVEGVIRGNGRHDLVHSVLARFGLYDDYSLLYRSIFEAFGYRYQ